MYHYNKLSMFNFFKKKRPERTYLSSSEFVSAGHPDRLSDDLASIIINDIQKKDGTSSHAAIEVFLTHDSVVIGGEATTTLDLNYPYLKSVVSKAFRRAGYIPEMRKFWTKDEVLLPSNMKVVNKICAQSVDIALGTTDKGEESGWNDQGVYFSSAECTTDSKMGVPMYLAQQICEGLQEISCESILNPEFYGCENCKFVLGPDNKAVVTCRVKEDGFTPIEVTAVTVAVAHASCTDIECVRKFVKKYCTTIIEDNHLSIAEDCQWVINGTGRFVIHGPISDTSMTGRKISVNHPSAGPVWANKMIGGGSLVKPMHASDLILNLMSRFIANIVVQSGLSTYAVVGTAGAIGVQGVQSLFINGDQKFMNSDEYDKVLEFFKTQFIWSPNECAKVLGFFTEDFDFSTVVDRNFFGHLVQPWEDPRYIDSYVDKLRNYIG